MDERDVDAAGTLRLGDLHPDIARRAHDVFAEQTDPQGDRAKVDRQLRYLDRVVDVSPPRDVLIVGCGPRPEALVRLAEVGHRPTGLDVVPSFVEAARLHLGNRGQVAQGSVERLPFDDASFDIVWCEWVLEHVDGPFQALRELARVLRPGGIAIVATTNRLQIIPERSGEFAVPFFRWLPAVVRESYVFEHLHRRPALARWTSRPAVHWFTFAQLCAMGREAGFARFYSLVDLVREDDPAIVASSFRRAAVRLINRSPWIRAAALTQVGSTVIMLKRPSAEG